jgi:ABC-type antimicrobial peptide transport system permease subunit
MVITQALQLVIVGLVFGILCVGAASRAIQSTIFGVTPGDPVLLFISCAVIVLTSFGASCLPAARAASVQPMDALRTE